MKTAIKPFLVIISITDKKKKIKKTKKLFPVRAHFLRFREFPGMSIVKTDGQQKSSWFTFVDKRRDEKHCKKLRRKNFRKPLAFFHCLCYTIVTSADVAHPVERHLPKVDVAGSSPVIRSISSVHNGLRMNTRFLFSAIWRVRVLGCRLGRRFCCAEVSTGHPRPVIRSIKPRCISMRRGFSFLKHSVAKLR